MEATKTREPFATPRAASDKREKNRVLRARLAGLLLAAVALAAVAAGVWALLPSSSPPAAMGETVEVAGGTLRVDAVTPETMAPMQADKFAASGMNMSAMGMDMAPEGERRFTVEVTLEASGGDLGYAAEDFRVEGEGTEPSAPIRGTPESATVPDGAAVSGTLLFQVPEEAKDLTLVLDGGRPVALDAGPPAGEDRHGGGHEHQGE